MQVTITSNWLKLSPEQQKKHQKIYANAIVKNASKLQPPSKDIAFVPPQSDT